MSVLIFVNISSVALAVCVLTGSGMENFEILIHLKFNYV